MFGANYFGEAYFGEDSPYEQIIVSDSSTVTNPVNVALAHQINVSDSSTITDPVGRMLDANVNVNNTSNVTESLGELLTSNINVNDTSTVTNPVTMLLNSNINVSDSSTISESRVQSFSYSTFTDIFTSIDSAVWTTTQAGSATVANTNQQVVITYPVACTSSTDGDITSVRAYDLTSTYASIQVVGVPSAATHAQAELRLFTSSTNYINWVYEAGSLYAKQDVAGSLTTLATLTYNSVTHRYWRIRESSGTTYWDTSSDGGVWTNRASAANPIVVNSLQAKIMGSCYQIEVNPGSFLVEDFNTNNDIDDLSDNVGVTDSINLLMTSFVNKSDSSTVTDSLTMYPVFIPSVSDSSTITESTQIMLQSYVSTSDSSTATEGTSLLIPELYANVSDSSTVTEFLANGGVPNPNVSDTVSVGEAMLVSDEDDPAIMDSVSVTENLNPYVQLGDTRVSDNVVVGESIQPSIVNFVNVNDSSGVTDSITALSEDKLVTVSDSSTVTENMNVNLVSLVNVTDSSGVTDSQVVFTDMYYVNIKDIIGPYKIIILTDGRLALRLKGNLYLPL